MTKHHTLAIRFGWVSLFQDLGSKMVVPVLPLFLVASGATPFAVGLIDGVGTAAAALIAPFAGRVSMRRRPRPLVQLGYGLSSVAKLALALPFGWGYVLGVRVVDRLGKGIRDAPRDVMLAAGEPNRHGRTFGIQQAMDKTGGFIGPLIGLAIYHLFGDHFEAIFVAAFIPCAISVGLLWTVPNVAPARPSNTQPSNTKPSPSGTETNSSRATRSQRLAVLTTGLHGLAFVPTSLLLLKAAAIGMSVSSIVVAYAGLRLVTALVSYPSSALVDQIGAATVVATGFAIFLLPAKVQSPSSPLKPSTLEAE